MVAFFVSYITGNKITVDVDMRVNLYEMFYNKETCRCTYRSFNFKTGPRFFVFIWLAFVKETKEAKEFARCMCGTCDHVDAIPRPLYLIAYIYA